MSCMPILNMNLMSAMYNNMQMAMPASPMSSIFPMPMMPMMPMQMPIFMPMMNPYINMGNNNVSQSSKAKTQGTEAPQSDSGSNAGSINLSDAELKEIGFKSADQRKRWSKLTPETQRALIELGKYAKEQGIEITVISSWRSQGEQASLAKRKPGVAAPAGKSPHQRGLAVDIRVNGNRTKNLAILGAKWESMGYTWGKNWKGWTPEDWHFDTRKKKA